MCTVLLPLDGNPIAVKYITSYQYSNRVDVTLLFT